MDAEESQLVSDHHHDHVSLLSEAPFRELDNKRLRSALQATNRFEDKPFRFLDLPPEIRRDIYEQCTPNRVTFYLKQKKYPQHCKDVARLLQTCRLVRAEALPILPQAELCLNHKALWYGCTALLRARFSEVKNIGFKNVRYITYSTLDFQLILLPLVVEGCPTVRSLRIEHFREHIYDFEDILSYLDDFLEQSRLTGAKRRVEVQLFFRSTKFPCKERPCDASRAGLRSHYLLYVGSSYERRIPTEQLPDLECIEFHYKACTTAIYCCETRSSERPGLRCERTEMMIDYGEGEESVTRLRWHVVDATIQE